MTKDEISELLSETYKEGVRAGFELIKHAMSISEPNLGNIKKRFKNEFMNRGWNETMLHCTVCSGKLLESNKVLLSCPKQFQFKCMSCNRRYLKIEGENNLHFHFDQQCGGE